MNLPSIESLQCFVEAARLLNFRAAAQAVSLSPAALGQRIRQLEDELEVSLFRRTTRTVVLTEPGLALLPQAVMALNAVQGCAAAVHTEPGAVPLELTLGTRHELGMSWIVPMLPTLSRRHPGMTLHLYFGSGLDLHLRVRTGAIDCAVTSTRLIDPKLDSIRLHQEHYTFMASPKLLKRSSFRRAEDAGNHTLIDINRELPLFRYWRDAPGGIDSMQFGAVLTMGTIAAVRQSIVRSEGVAVLPAYYVGRDLRAKRLTRVMTGVKAMSDYFRLVIRADDPRRSYFDALAETMRSSPLR